MILSSKPKSTLPEMKSVIRNENGAVLVIGIMFMAILLMLGGAAVLTTTTDMKIGANYRRHSQTFYHADGGVQFVLGTIENDLKNGTTVANGTTDILPTTVLASEPFTAASPSDFNLTFSDITLDSTSPDTFSFTSTSKNPDGSKAVIDVLFVRSPDPAFEVGMISEGNLTITGAPTIDGGIHSNNNVTQNSHGGTVIGSISAVGSAGGGSCNTPHCTLTQNADRIPVPLIKDPDDFVKWKTKAIASGTDYTGPCTYSDPGAGNIYFCDGNITFANSLNTSQSDVTIIATGDIDANGSSVKRLDGTTGLAFIAGGNITISGGGGASLKATFWCNGNYLSNGSRTVEGSIVAGGAITQHGSSAFVQDDNIDNKNLPCSNKMIAWKDSMP